MTKKAKEIYTFTRLLELAEKLKVSDPREYKELFGWRGTSKLVDGLGVQAERNDLNCLFRFNFRHLGQSDDYCSLTGSVVEGKCYTRWLSKFSTSYFSKKLQRFLPWDLPEGAKMRKDTPAMFFNGNGTLALYRKEGWYGSSRGNWGYPSLTMAMRDCDGKFVLPNDPETTNLPLGRADPVQECLGIAPDSVWPREWFDSMVGPHWNSSRVRLLAIRAYKEALRVVEAHPHMRIALYPMQEKKIADEYVPSRIGKTGGFHVVERDSDMEPIMYRMPELCLYWVVEADKHPTLNPHRLHFIYVTIPPHGCRLLQMDCEKIPEKGKTFRHGKRTAPDAYNHAVSRGAPLERVAYTFSPKAKGVGDTVDWGNSPELVRVKRDGQGAKALKPEDAFNSIEEDALMSSLPLC